MKWWRWKKTKDREPSEATKARQQAEIDLERTRRQTPAYAALGESLAEIRRKNHLTELFIAVHRRND